MSSGSFAGEGAAKYAAALGEKKDDRVLRGLSSTIISGREGSQTAAKTAEYVRAVQEEVAPYDRNLFREGNKLNGSITRLDDVWNEIRNGSIGLTTEASKAREAAAMTATARWMYHSALQRTETRGMHKREDFPTLDEAQHYRLISGGLDRVWVREEAVEKEAALV